MLYHYLRHVQVIKDLHDLPLPVQALGMVFQTMLSRLCTLSPFSDSVPSATSSGEAGLFASGESQDTRSGQLDTSLRTFEVCTSSRNVQVPCGCDFMKWCRVGIQLSKAAGHVDRFVVEELEGTIPGLCRLETDEITTLGRRFLQFIRPPRSMEEVTWAEHVQTEYVVEMLPFSLCGCWHPSACVVRHPIPRRHCHGPIVFKLTFVWAVANELDGMLDSETSRCTLYVGSKIKWSTSFPRRTVNS